MAYIGKEPIVGNFQKCDALTASATADYTLQVSSTNVVPESANHMLVSLNGILQAPVTSFSVSGSTLTFVSNLATGDVIDFVILLGNVLDLGTVSDGTISTAKIIDSAVTTAKLANAAASNWRLTTTYEVGTTSKAYHTSNLEAVDTTGQGILGSSMTESSGVFTFPSTGIWYVGHHLYVYDPTDWAYCYCEIDVTTNNADYTEVAQAVCHNYDGTGNREASAYASTLVDVTDTANVKVKVGLLAATTGVNVWGDTARNGTSFQFIRLGDT